MTKGSRISGDLAEQIAAVTNKRARFVLDTIAKKGIVTTEEISQADTSTRLVLLETHGSSDFPSAPSK